MGIKKEIKKLGKLKLNQLSKVELEQREIKALKGGYGCGCSCACYPGNLGSNSSTNSNNITFV